MQYALLIYTAPEASARAIDGSDEGAEMRSTHIGTFDEWMAFTRALKDTRALVALQRLQPAETATSVRVRDGERLLTDGPFIETKEHLLGFYLIEAPDLDTALEWAARMPHVRYGTAEVRPVQPTTVLAQIAAE